MASIAALPRSVFSSRRGSKNRDDLVGGGHAPARHETPRTPANPSADNKIAVPNTSLHNASNSLEGDSMKYPLESSPPKKLIEDTFGVDFGKALLDDDRLKSLGFERAVLGGTTAATKPADDVTVEKIPVASSGIEWKTNVFELDVPNLSARKSTLQPGLILRDEEDTPLPTKSRRHSRDGLKTPEQNLSPKQVRKGSVPAIHGSPDGKEVVVRPPRPLSIKSVANSALSRGADAPEVVPPRQYGSRNGPPSASLESRPRLVQNNRPVLGPQSDGRRPSATGAGGPAYRTEDRRPSASDQSSAGPPTHARPLRPMQSSPALHHGGAPAPMSPAVPKPWMSRRPSAGSLRGGAPTNINKPLPPEPPGYDVVSSPHSTNPTTPRVPLTPAAQRLNNLQETQPSSPAQGQFLSKENRSRTAPVGKLQLRSKFAKDLDALDDAFQRSAQPGSGAQPPLTAADMSFRDQLDPIRESPRTSQYFDPSAPLQIKRGPMDMIPSREAPPTPKGPGRGVSPTRLASRNQSVPSTPRRPSAAHQKLDANVQQFRSTQRKAPATTRALDTAPAEKRPIDTNRPVEIRPLDIRPPDARPPEVHSSESRAPVTAPPESRLPPLQPPENRPSDAANRATESPMVRRGPVLPKAQRILGEETPAVIDGPTIPPPPTQKREPFARPQPHLDRDVFTDSPLEQGPPQPLTRGESFSDTAGGPFRSGTSDAQFDEIRRRLEMFTPTTTADSSSMSTQTPGQVLSPQMTIMSGSPQMSSDGEGPMGTTTKDAGQAPAEGNRPKSMSPVELPADMSWAAQPQQAFEMDATERPRIPIGQIPQPPPIPQSPKYDLAKGLMQRHSTVSSGTGRTKSLRSVKSARSARSAKARSLSSLAISEIQELYAGLPSPRTTLASRRPSVAAEETIPEIPPMPDIMTTEELEEKDSISADVAEQVLYQILRNLHEPEDLFNASLVSRGFQRTFRRHDTKLLRHALWYTSGPAWEYLEMHMPISGESGQLEYPPNLYREQYVRDMRCMAKLKTLILQHCGNILSRPTFNLLCAKNTLESAPVDDAIWRIWTFCKIFGEDLDRREDLEMQKRWIKGQTMEEAHVEAHVQGGHRGKYVIKEYPAFAFGNDEGLTPEELIRMGEIWLCLRRLVRGYSGQRAEAREYGIFEGTDIVPNDLVREEAILDEWTIYLLSMAPGTNIEVLAPVRATANNFIKAEQLGYTSWTPPEANFISSGFLTGPICSVLEEWLATDPIGGNPHLGLRPSGMSIINNTTVAGAPSHQTVAGFISQIRTSQDGRDFRKLLNGPRPGLSTNVSQNTAPAAVPEAPAPAAAPKPTKESKRSKFSIRLPSRSQTQAKKSRSKALAPSEEAPRAAITPSPNGGESASAPGSPPMAAASNNSSRFDLIRRNITQRTRKNSAVKDEKPTNLFANATVVQSGRLSPGNVAGAPPASAGQASQAGVFADSQDLHNVQYSDTSMPIAVASRRFIEQGYDPTVVDRVMLENSSDGRVNFNSATKKMKKTQKLRERLMRLDRMG